MQQKIRCLIVDDEPAAHYVLAEYIEKAELLELHHQLYNGFDALNYLKKNQVDLMFLDINMPEISGIDLLRNIKNKPKTILTTAYSEYALEGYEYGVVDYLLKPIDFARFLKAIDNFQEVNSLGKLDESVLPEIITLKVGSDTVDVPLKEILFFKSYGNYVKVYGVNRNYVATITTAELESRLPSKLFCRAHKSYIIALNQVRKLEGNSIFIRQTEIPIGITFKRELTERVGEMS